jgi:hypothetical protein
MSTLLFHWSPTSRRKAITRRGLVPGSLSTDRLWRPPFVCLSDSPSLAWVLSGDTARGRLVSSWDLWCVWDDRLNGYEVLPFDDEPDRVKEYRVYQRIFKRDLWYVGTRGAA